MSEPAPIADNTLATAPDPAASSDDAVAPEDQVPPESSDSAEAESEDAASEPDVAPAADSSAADAGSNRPAPANAGAPSRPKRNQKPRSNSQPPPQTPEEALRMLARDARHFYVTAHQLDEQLQQFEADLPEQRQLLADAGAQLLTAIEALKLGTKSANIAAGRFDNGAKALEKAAAKADAAAAKFEAATAAADQRAAQLQSQIDEVKALKDQIKQLLAGGTLPSAPAPTPASTPGPLDQYDAKLLEEAATAAAQFDPLHPSTENGVAVYRHLESIFSETVAHEILLQAAAGELIINFIDAHKNLGAYSHLTPELAETVSLAHGRKVLEDIGLTGVFGTNDESNPDARFAAFVKFGRD